MKAGQMATEEQAQDGLTYDHRNPDWVVLRLRGPSATKLHIRIDSIESFVGRRGDEEVLTDIRTASGEDLTVRVAAGVLDSFFKQLALQRSDVMPPHSIGVP